MTLTDGKIVADYEAHCGGDGCYENVLGLGRSREGAAKQLLRHSWSRLQGKWYCQRCARVHQANMTPWRAEPR